LIAVGQQVTLRGWEDAIVGAIPLIQLIVAYITRRGHKASLTAISQVQSDVSTGIQKTDQIQSVVNGRLDSALSEIERLKTIVETLKPLLPQPATVVTPIVVPTTPEVTPTSP
jgi:hypothetical protein